MLVKVLVWYNNANFIQYLRDRPLFVISRADNLVWWKNNEKNHLRYTVSWWDLAHCSSMRKEFLLQRDRIFYVPHGAQSATTSVRTFFSELYVRERSFLPCTKAHPGASVKGGLCQGTPSEGFARRKVIWDRKLWVTPRERVANFLVVRTCDSDCECYHHVQSCE